ncbi:MAG: MarR family transcriptional regulator [Pseudolysinimonas sp.]
MSDASGPSGFVDRAAGELIVQGFPRVPAKVIIALTASEEGRLTASDLAESLGVSTAAVSGAIRYLTTVGMVRSSTVRGTRRHIYSLPERPWYTVSLTKPGVYTQFIGVLQSELERMPASAARDRIAEMSEFFVFLETRMPRLYEEWIEARAGN